MNIFLLLVLLAEAVLLFRLEKKMWHTGYTPLNFLMIPYVAVLAITLLFAGHFGLDDFYYPSLLPWIAGLPLFALPGWLFFLAERRCPAVETPQLNHSQKSYRFQIYLAIAILIALSVRLVFLLVQGKGLIGSEAFGLLFASHGWAGHLLLLGVALMILLLFEKRTWLTWLVVAGMLFFLFVYQVKSWIILPLLSVFFALLISRRIKFSFRCAAWIGLGAVAVFFASYLLIYVSGNTLFPQFTTVGEQLKSISGLFLHYLTSGTLGLSADMQQGILEEPDWQYIFTPFYNLWFTLTGQPVVSGVNNEFLHTGINLTNVRGFFGTLFVFTRPAGFALCCLLFGTASQLVFWLFRHYKTVCTTLLFAWVCTVLFMGWFEYLFCLETIFEIPFWILFITFVQWIFCRS